jgi:MFS family permease
VAPTATTAPETATATGSLWEPRWRVLTGGLVAIITLVAFEALAVVTVLPVVSTQLHGIGLYGWATSAFFLTTVVGIVLAGAATDRVGPARPFVAGMLLFGAGLAVAATAPTMPVLVAGRALQGLGGGAVPAISYATIGRVFPSELRPRVFAVLSTAWVVPGLGGPALSAFIAEQVGWRWIFGGLIPLVVVAGTITTSALRQVGPPAEAVESAPGTLLRAIRVSAGAGLVLAGLTTGSLLTIPLVLGGLAVGVGPLRRLLPPGTLRARPGVPAAIAVRGLLTFAFFGADTFVPLAVTAVRHASTTTAGIAVSTATICWTTGSWTQARLASRWSGRDLVTVGLSAVVLGVTGTGVLLLSPGVPLVCGVACWGLAGFGIGISYSPIMNVALAAASADRQGAASSAVSLTDNLGVVFGAGIGGVALALATASGSATTAHAGSDAARLGIAVAFACASGVGLLGVLVARRLPTTVLTAGPPAAPTPLT